MANPLYLPVIGEPQPHSFNFQSLNDAHCDRVYEAAVDAIEESVVNAMIAAESVPTIKPPGRVLEAIDHGELLRTMRGYRPFDGVSGRGLS